MKRILVLLLTVVIILCLWGGVSVNAATTSDLTFKLNSDGISYYISDCSTSASGELVIPDTYNSKPVTRIGDYAFMDCTGLTSVTIGNNVTSIGYDAFRSCTSLISINIPDSVTSIESFAFNYCTRLESVTIGTGVISIGFEAFYNCTSLTSITIPNSVTDISEDAFEGCSSLENVYITDIAKWCGICFADSYSNPLYYANNLYLNGELVTDLVIPEGVTSIGELAFIDCTNLTSITIPDSVTSIGYYAFRGCSSLKSVTIGTGVTSIGSYAFYDCTGLTGVYIKDIAKWCDICFADLDSNPLYYADNLYLNGELVTDLVIPEGVTSIGGYAFYNCTSLTSITIPDSVTSIGYYAFRNCQNLASIVIGNGVTSIGSSAFRDCTSITSITIPCSVTSIGNYAFSGCTKLNAVYITDIAKWCGISFSNYLSNPLYYAENLYLNGELVTDLTIPNGVTSIGEYAFEYCTSLTSITIPDSVTSIGIYAFRGCSSLKSVTIGTGVTSIGTDAFYNLKSLEKIYWNAKSVTDFTASSNLFYNAGTGSGIEVVFGDTVEKIPAYLFYVSSSFYRPKVTSVTIGKNVTSIGYSAFYDCTSLNKVYWNAKNVSDFTSSSDVFYNAGTSGSGIEVVFGDTVETIPAYLFCVSNFSYRPKVTSVTIGSNVTSIGDYAFYKCTGLEKIYWNAKSVSDFDSSSNVFYNAGTSSSGIEVVFGDTVENIPAYLFYVSNASNKPNVTKITIGNNVTSIGSYTFYNCTSLTSVEIPDSVTSIGDYAFHGCTNLTSVEIPDSVTSIGDYAFYGCTNLTSVTIGKGVTNIGEKAFYNTGYYNNETNWENSVLYKNCVLYIGDYFIKAKDFLAATYEIKAGTKTVAASAFSGCSNLTSITIPDSVTNIGKDAFYNCTSLEDVYITDIAKWCGITFVNPYANPTYYAYNFCLNGELVTEVVIPDGVTSVPDYTFYNCANLVSVTVPDSVTSIGISAFNNCANLTSVVLADSVVSIGSYAFNNCAKITSITIPDSVTKLGGYAFYGCSDIKSVVIGKGLTSIGDYTFYNCTSLNKIYWNAKSVADFTSSSNVFYNAGAYGTGIEVVFDDTVEKIPAYLFYASSKPNVVKVTIGENATDIGGYAFYNCAGINSITIPDGVTSIGDSAFSGCSSLKSVTIGTGVNSIGINAFKDCTSLNGVYVSDIAKWCSISFGNSYSNPLQYAYTIYLNGEVVIDLVVPDGVTVIGDYAFYNCTNLSSIIVPDSVNNIGKYAFYNCRGLASITIPEGVPSIGDYTFYYCTSLASVNIPDSVTSIGEGAFYGCIELVSVTIPENLKSIGGKAFYSCLGLEELYWNAINISSLTTSSDVFYRVGRSGTGMKVVFGDTVEKIPAYLFYVTSASNKPNVTKVTLGENVTDIGAYAFYNCVGINSIIIPDSVTSVGSYTFNGCTGLKSVTVGKGVTSIGERAFYNCVNLENVYYCGLLINWGDITIADGNDNLLTATFSHLCTGDNWIIDSAATCEETGSKHGVCLVCGETVTEVVPALGHLSSTWIIDKTATCGDNGRKHKNCILCGVVTETEIIPATGEHVSSGWKIDAAATVREPGSKHTECTVCGETLETAVIPQLKPATPKVKAVNTIKGMKVTWNAVDGAVKYGLYKRLGTANTWTFVTTTTATSYADNNASYAGSYYVYTVKAYNSAGTPSDYVKANCASVQRVIAPYTYATNTVNGINVTWSKVSGANKYVVLRRLGTGSVWETLCTTTGTSFLDKNVTPGIYYLYSIRAVNNTGYSEYDVNKRVTIKRASYKPDTPTAVATNLANGVQVKWNSVTGATKYNVYRRVGGSSSWVLVGTTTGTSLVDKNITNGKYYAYSIRAINSIGYSVFDTKKTDTIQPITAPTPKLVNKSNGVHVSWNAVAGATKYNVYRRAAGSSTWVYVATTTSLGGLDTGVAKGNYYAYSIRAINGTGYSAYDGSKCASIKYS